MKSLLNVPDGEPAQLVSVSHRLLRKLRRYGLHLGDTLRDLRIAPMGGSLLVEVNGRELARGVPLQSIYLWRWNASRINPTTQLGKSTLFNQVAGYKAETGNFSGTTVAFTESRVCVAGEVIELVDLSGTYTLKAGSPAEE